MYCKNLITYEISVFNVDICILSVSVKITSEMKVWPHTFAFLATGFISAEIQCFKKKL